jgi:hypothetical protein
VVSPKHRMDFGGLVPFTAQMPNPQPAVHPVDRVPAWTQDRPGTTLDNAFVVVHREWNGWRNAMVRLAHLNEIRWVQPPGAPRPLIHAQVNCRDVYSGDLQHDCEPTSAPHPLLVWALKSHSAPLVFAELARRATEFSCRS